MYSKKIWMCFLKKKEFSIERKREVPKSRKLRQKHIFILRFVLMRKKEKVEIDSKSIILIFQFVLYVRFEIFYFSRIERAFNQDLKFWFKFKNLFILENKVWLKLNFLSVSFRKISIKKGNAIFFFEFLVLFPQL